MELLSGEWFGEQTKDYDPLSMQKLEAGAWQVPGDCDHLLSCCDFCPETSEGQNSSFNVGDCWGSCPSPGF